MRNLELFKLEDVALYYFKLGEVSFLFDEFYKEKILPQAKMLDDEDAYIFLFRETIAKKLTDYAYFLKPDFFFDTVVIKRKKKLDLKDINCWFEVVGCKSFGETYNISFTDVFSNTEEGLQVRVFRNDKDVAILKTMRDGLSKLLKF